MKAKQPSISEMESNTMSLRTVIGLTVSSNASLHSHPIDGSVAYPAGSTVVLLKGDGCAQSHLISTSRKSITCLTFSHDGLYLATGESGHQPVVRIWNLVENSVVVELCGHSFGVSCLRFCPQSEYLVSVGNEHDLMICVWNWRENVQVASNKVSCKLMAIAFAESGEYFVTVGVRHVKFWYIPSSSKPEECRLPLQGRSAILADQRNNVFKDVCCSAGKQSPVVTYAVTQSGLLCQFSSRRQLEKWVDLKIDAASSLCTGDNLIFVGCTDGDVRVFHATSLDYVCSLPKPHYLGVDVANRLPFGDRALPSGRGVFSYADVVAISYQPVSKTLCCIFNDHSLYLWNVSNCNRAVKVASLLAHSGSVWALEMCPAAKSKSTRFTIPPGTFVTCATDDTIRLWNANVPRDGKLPYGPNLHSDILLKIIYCDSQLTCLKDAEMNCLLSADMSNYQLDGKSGLRTVSVSGDGSWLASGHRNGNVCIYSMDTLEILQELPAHDGDVLCLAYSVVDQNGQSRFLATGSRDKLLHVLDARRQYEPVCTLDDHGGSVTAVKFAQSTDEDALQLLSSSADKTIIYRRIDPDRQIYPTGCITTQSTVYDMTIDERSDCVYAACQDCQVRIYALSDGHLKGCIKPTLSDEDSAIKVELDPSGSLLASCSRDKNVYIFDTTLSSSDKCIAVLSGHGELVTGVKFTDDCQHLITVSGDGCIFIWNVERSLMDEMMRRTSLANGCPVQRSREKLADQSNQLSSSAIVEDLTLDARPSPPPICQMQSNNTSWAQNDHKAKRSNNDQVNLNEATQHPSFWQPSNNIETMQTAVREEHLNAVVNEQSKWNAPAERNGGETQLKCNVTSSVVDNGQAMVSSSTEFCPLDNPDSVSTMRGQLLHPKVEESFESAVGKQLPADAGSFQRHAPARQSFTSKFFNRPGVERRQEQLPVKQWSPPGNAVSESPSRPSTSLSLASSLSGHSSAERAESDRVVSPKITQFQCRRSEIRLDIGQPNSTSSPMSPSAASSVSYHHQPVEGPCRPFKLPLAKSGRAETILHSYANRRHVTLPTYMSPCKLENDGYEQNELLHARHFSPNASRDSNISETCKSLLLKEVMTSGRRRFNGYGSEAGSEPAMRSSYSMTSLAQPDRRSATLRRLSDIRQKLRKSQENLWDYGGAADVASMVRSRSTTSLAANRMQRVNSSTSLADGAQVTNLRKRQEITRSMGFLPAAQDELSASSAVLAIAMQDRERLNRSDLPSYGSRIAVGKNQANVYGRSTTLPRFYRVNGPVQRRANQIRTGSRAGDSEDSSDTATPSGSVHRYASPRRRHGSNLSSADRYYDRCHIATSADRDRRLTESQRLLESLPNKRPSSYLRKLLDSVARQEGRNWRDSYSCDFDARDEEVDFQAPHYRKMDGHCKESVDSFMKALDKVLHAYNMVLDDEDLDDEEKRRLCALLTPKLENAQKRLDATLSLHGDQVAETTSNVLHDVRRKRF